LSNYGNPPSDPGGQPPQDPYAQGGQSAQDAYGQAPQGGFDQNPYGGPAYGQPDHGLPQGVTFASWGKRVGAALIDGLLGALVFIPALIGLIMLLSKIETTTDPVTNVTTSEMTGGTGGALALMAIGTLLALAFAIWNRIIKQGKSGYTIGKGIMGIKLVKAETGQPIGAGMAFLRYVVTQAISSFTCGVGGLVDVLWPLWDDKKQAIHDKVGATNVVVGPQPKR